MKRVTRRRLVAIAAALPSAGAVLAQAPPTPPADADLAKAAHEANRRISETLSKFEIPISTEPAFQFKA